MDKSVDEQKKIMSIISEDGTKEDVEVIIAFEFKDTKKEYEAGSKNYITKSCAGTCNIYYAGE